MPKPIAPILASSFTDHGIELLRVAAGVNRQALLLLAQLEQEIVGKLAAANLSYTESVRLNALLRDVKVTIERAYAKVELMSGKNLVELALLEFEISKQVVNSALGFELMTGTIPSKTWSTLVSKTLIQGAPSKDWWARQAAELQFKFSQEIRKGMMAGESNAQLIARIRGSESNLGIMSAPRRQVAALVQTSVQTVANTARLQAFKENSDMVTGVQQISTLDNRTSDVCIAYDHETWDLDGNPIRGTKLPFNGGPPRHWNCRSGLIPLLKSWRELGVDLDEMNEGTRASMDGQVSAKMSFEDWLETRSEAQQNEILGRTKAQMWRENRITLKDLLDQTGAPLSVTDLRRRHRL